MHPYGGCEEGNNKKMKKMMGNIPSIQKVRPHTYNCGWAQGEAGLQNGKSQVYGEL